MVLSGRPSRRQRFDRCCRRVLIEQTGNDECSGVITRRVSLALRDMHYCGNHLKTLKYSLLCSIKLPSCKSLND